MGRFKQWEELTIQDNFLFQKVMQNQRICKYLIEKILDIRIEKITFPEGEKSIDNRYDSKSIRLESMCTMKTAMSMTSRCNVRMAAKGNSPSGPATIKA